MSASDSAGSGASTGANTKDIEKIDDAQDLVAEAIPEAADLLQVSETLSDQGEDLVEGALPAIPSIEPAPKAEKREFFPWHKPRKHYIRIHQWCAQARELIRQIGLSPSTNPRPLRYLSLPGDELLDIRTLQGVCKSADVKLQYLGYNAVGGKRRARESDLSESEVKGLGSIYSSGSLVLHDALQEITRTDTVAYQTALRQAPFDIINLDLCGSIADKPPQTQNGTLQTIRNLVELQIAKRAEPWLFFVTTMVTRDAIDSQVLKSLNSQIVRNAVQSRLFSNCLREEIGLRTEHLQDQSRGVQQTGEHLSHKQFAFAFGLGLGKWLLDIVQSRNWTVELLDSFGYKVYSDPFDMCSLSFRFSYFPPQVPDPSGLTSPGPLFSSLRPEPEAAAAMVKKIAAMRDVDILLESDSEAMAKITKQSATILAQARYDEAAYYEWVKAGYPKGS